MERVLRSALPLHYYRCHDCNWRGMRLRRRTIRQTVLIVAGVALVFVVFAIARPIIKLMIYLLFS